MGNEEGLKMMHTAGHQGNCRERKCPGKPLCLSLLTLGSALGVLTWPGCGHFSPLEEVWLGRHQAATVQIHMDVSTSDLALSVKPGDRDVSHGPCCHCALLRHILEERGVSATSENQNTAQSTVPVSDGEAIPK